MKNPPATDAQARNRVFEAAADLFGLLSAPLRLRILCALCDGERNVGELLAHLHAGASPSLPSLSQHLGLLVRSGVLGRRRAGTHMFYRITSQRVRLLCDALCHEEPR